MYSQTIEDRLNREISPQDGMRPRKTDDLEGYFRVGRDVLKVVSSAFEIEGKPDPKFILDYGCGHGRVLRWFRAYYPDAFLFGADIKGEGIRFCRENFNARPVLCDKPFREMTFNQKFDLIWLGSVYTHIDRKGWDELTQMLTDHLKVQGVLAFSFAGDFVYEIYKNKSAAELRLAEDEIDGVKDMVKQYEDSGFGFMTRDYESTDPWGRSISHRSFVLDFVKQRSMKILLFTERRYGSRQDIVVAQKIAS